MAVRIWSIAVQGFKEPVLIESDVKTPIMLIHNAYSLVNSKRGNFFKANQLISIFCCKNIKRNMLYNSKLFLSILLNKIQKPSLSLQASFIVLLNYDVEHV